MDALNKLLWYCGGMNIHPATVIVVENHLMMRAAICTAIADEPDLTIVAITANSGDVLLMVETLHPDLILFAVGNPGQDDLSALKCVHKALPSIPILALTSNEVAGQEQAVLDCGAQAVITKPAPRHELIDKLRELRSKAITNDPGNNL